MTEYACDQCEVRFKPGPELDWWIVVNTGEEPDPIYRFCGNLCQTKWQIENTKYRLMPNIEPEFPPRNKP